MELLMIFFIFLIMMGISSILNILFQMTSKKDWLLSLFISLGLAIILGAILVE